MRARLWILVAVIVSTIAFTGDHASGATRQQVLCPVVAASTSPPVDAATSKCATPDGIPAASRSGGTSAQSIVGGVVGWIGDHTVGAVADAVFERVTGWIADLISSAVKLLTGLIIRVFDLFTVQIGTDGVLQGGASQAIQTEMLSLAGALLLLLFLIRIIGALITSSMGRLFREMAFDLPLIIAATVGAGALVALLLVGTDEMAAQFSAQFSENLGSFAGTFFSKEALVDGGLLWMVFAVLYSIGALLIAAELIVRASLLTIIVVFAPVMIATRTWDGSRRYMRRFTELTIALILGKPAIALALAIGSAQLADGAEAADLVQLLIGTTVVLLAAYMPFALARIIPFVESGVTAQSGISHAPARAAQSGLMVAGNVSRVAGAIQRHGKSPLKADTETSGSMSSTGSARPAAQSANAPSGTAGKAQPTAKPGARTTNEATGATPPKSPPKDSPPFTGPPQPFGSSES